MPVPDGVVLIATPERQEDGLTWVPASGYLTLEYMQSVVEGDIEALQLGASRHRPHVMITMIVNEDGKRQDLPVNLVFRFKNGSDVIRGPALFCGTDLVSGESVPLVDEEASDVTLVFPAGVSTVLPPGRAPGTIGDPNYWRVLKPIRELVVAV